MSKLPENAARPLKNGEQYEPILKPTKDYPEVSLYSVSMGVLMAVIFSAAAAYLVCLLGIGDGCYIQCGSSFFRSEGRTGF